MVDVPRARAARIQLWFCASCEPKGVESRSLGRPLGVCSACGQVAKNPACYDLETVLAHLAKLTTRLVVADRVARAAREVKVSIETGHQQALAAELLGALIDFDVAALLQVQN